MKDLFATESEIAERIRSRGARATPSRIKVLGVLEGGVAPLSHGEIEQALANDASYVIDRVTLYRVLDWLVEAGLAHKAADARGVFRFSAAAPNVCHSEHVHFRCTGCGRVYCLKASPPAPPVLPDGFQLTDMELDIRGLCPDCAVREGE
jgi:Fur family ferric uptake transcriptional regulator